MASSRPSSRTGQLDPGKKRRKAFHTDVVLEGAVSPGHPGYDKLKDKQARGLSACTAFAGGLKEGEQPSVTSCDA